MIIDSGPNWASDVLRYCVDFFHAVPHNNQSEIAWLAGLLEGEAAFIFSKNSPSIALQSTDEDVVQRVAKLLDITDRKPWKPKGKESYKQVFGCRIYGVRAVVWMMVIYDHLGFRRRSRIKEIVDQWLVAAHPKAPRGKRWPAICHPNRFRTGDGLCKACYMRRWRERKKLAKQKCNNKVLFD